MIGCAPGAPGNATGMDSTRPDHDVATSAFAHELRLRLVEAATSLRAAESLGDPLLAQIAESDLADLRALAARNDVALEH